MHMLKNIKYGLMLGALLAVSVASSAFAALPADISTGIDAAEADFVALAGLGVGAVTLVAIAFKLLPLIKRVVRSL